MKNLHEILEQMTEAANRVTTLYLKEIGGVWAMSPGKCLRISSRNNSEREPKRGAVVFHSCERSFGGLRGVLVGVYTIAQTMFNAFGLTSGCLQICNVIFFSRLCCLLSEKCSPYLNKNFYWSYLVIFQVQEMQRKSLWGCLAYLKESGWSKWAKCTHALQWKQVVHSHINFHIWLPTRINSFRKKFTPSSSPNYAAGSVPGNDHTYRAETARQLVFLIYGWGKKNERTRVSWLYESGTRAYSKKNLLYTCCINEKHQPNLDYARVNERSLQ